MKTIWSLVIISSLLLGHPSLSQAMGSKPKEQKYKLEILKMEFVTSPLSPETGVTAIKKVR